MLKNHLEYLLTYFEHPISNAVAEGHPDSEGWCTLKWNSPD